MPSARSGSAAAVRALGQHRWLVLVLALGVVLRGLLIFGVPQAMWFLGDSVDYVEGGTHLEPGDWRPSTYSVMLRVLRPTHNLLSAVVVQHVMGLMIAVAVYAFLLRCGVRKWIAALAAVPVVLDGYLLVVEHMLLAETLFTLFVVVALLVLAWSAPPGPVSAALGGALLGLSATTRTVGSFVILVACLFLLARRARLVTLLAAVVGFAVPVTGYAAWSASTVGEFTISPSSGFFLYGQVSAFADCAKLDEPYSSSELCPPGSPAARAAAGMGPLWFIFSPESPLGRASGSRQEKNAEALAFGREVVLRQPEEYAALVGDEIGRTFTLVRQPSVYVVPTDPVELPYPFDDTARTYQAGMSGTVVPRDWTGPLREYARLVTVPGPLYLLGLLVVLGGVLVGRNPGQRRLRSTAFLFGGSAVVLLLVPPFTVPYDYRYVLPALPLLCVAVPLSLIVIVERVRRVRRVRRVPDTTPSSVHGGLAAYIDSP